MLCAVASLNSESPMAVMSMPMLNSIHDLVTLLLARTMSPVIVSVSIMKSNVG